MADAAYEAAVKTTFETKPLRTVLLIDDEFPTFSDLACGETEENKTKFAQKDRAVRLYEGLRKHHMNCDFENTATGLEIDRFRKSDLIILDYHLGPTPNDTETSIKLLRELSLSKHFNTVIVYTEEPNLDKVWLDIVAAVSGGWKAFTDDLEGVASEKWEELSDRDALPTAPLEASMQFARRREIRDLDSEVRGPVQSELEALEVPATTCGDIITAMIHRDMVARAGMYAAEPHQPTLGDYREGVRWIQTQNSFVCILQKDDSEPVGEETEKLMVYLRRALLAWRPNLFQILVSEIQNILELEALTTVNHLLGEATTHTALWCYLLETIGPVDPTSNPNVRAPFFLQNTTHSLPLSVERRGQSRRRDPSEVVRGRRIAGFGERCVVGTTQRCRFDRKDLAKAGSE